jgi:hypothetical protein
VVEVEVSGKVVVAEMVHQEALVVELEVVQQVAAAVEVLEQLGKDTLVGIGKQLLGLPLLGVEEALE